MAFRRNSPGGCVSCGCGSSTTTPVVCDDCMKGADVPTLTFNWRYSTASNMSSPTVDGEATLSATITWNGTFWISTPQTYPWHYWGLAAGVVQEPATGSTAPWVTLGMRCRVFTSAPLVRWFAAIGARNAANKNNGSCGLYSTSCQDVTSGGFYPETVGNSPATCSPFHYYYYNSNALGKFDEMEITQ